MGISTIIGALARGLRRLLVMEADQAWTPLRVGIYTFLGLIALMLGFAWLTATPLECITGGVCER